MSAEAVDPGPAYLALALQYASNPAVEPPSDASGSEDPKTVLLSASRAGVTLACQVDRATHRILRLRHTGARTDAGRGLLNALVSVMAGWSIQDASEHAGIRLENLLRQRSASPAVAGIIQPENADPAFHLPLTLVRALFAQYREKTGYASKTNFEDAPAAGSSSEWGTSTLPERIQKILAAVPEICRETGVRKSDIVIKGIDLGRKVTIQVRHDDTEVQQQYLSRLELDLRKRVDPKIELYLEPRKDANTKRHK